MTALPFFFSPQVGICDPTNQITSTEPNAEGINGNFFKQDRNVKIKSCWGAGRETPNQKPAPEDGRRAKAPSGAEQEAWGAEARPARRASRRKE